MFERFLSQGIHLTCDDDVDAAWRAWNVCSPPPLGLSHRLLKAHQSVITESGIADRFFLFKKDLEGAAKSRDVPTPVISPVGRTAGVERWAPPCYRVGLENTGPSRPSPFVAARRSRRPLGGGGDPHQSGSREPADHGDLEIRPASRVDRLPKKGEAMPVTHGSWLVALSIIVAIQGAYVGLSLAVQVAAAGGFRRRLLLAGAAISLAVAIWAMHYVGMSALHASAHLAHASMFVAASVVVAIAASGLALWLAAGRGGRPPLLLSAIALGMAIAGMHYTAMAGLTLVPHPGPASGAPSLSTDLLAIVVAFVAFLVSGIFLLTFVPDRSATIRTGATPSSERARAPEVEPDPTAPVGIAGTIDTHLIGNGLGQGTYAPLGGAGGPPRRPARHLPVERDGATQFVAIDDIVAVHANAHYAYVFNGKSKLFCPLAIGQIEARLDAERFIRVHRSHIVNIDRVAVLKRAGDNGVIELAGTGRYTVPVSRSRLRWLRSRLDQKTGEDGL